MGEIFESHQQLGTQARIDGLVDPAANSRKPRGDGAGVDRLQNTDLQFVGESPSKRVNWSNL